MPGQPASAIDGGQDDGFHLARRSYVLGVYLLCYVAGAYSRLAFLLPNQSKSDMNARQRAWSNCCPVLFVIATCSSERHSSSVIPYSAFGIAGQWRHQCKYRGRREWRRKQRAIITLPNGSFNLMGPFHFLPVPYLSRPGPREGGERLDTCCLRSPTDGYHFVHPN